MTESADIDPSDKIAIERLVHLAALTFDDARFEELAALFARATVDVGLAAPMVGAAGMRAFVADKVILHRGKPRTQHRISNLVVSVAENRLSATAESYVLVIQGLDGVLAPILAARYEDSFERDDDGWYFVRRVGRGGMAGNLDRHMRS